MKKCGLKKIISSVVACLFVVGCTDANFSPFNSQDTKAQESSPNPMSPAVPCGNESCSLEPLVVKPSVTTVLMALGDQSGGQLVLDTVSAQFIAESVVRITSPVVRPRILFVRDIDDGNEDPEDAVITLGLLKRYNVTKIEEPAVGLSLEQLQGFDLIWFNNPGYPMSSRKTLESLLQFKGSVVLQGDDMTWGSENGQTFSLAELTGVESIDNGTQVLCTDGHSYDHGGGSGPNEPLPPYLFRVSVDRQIIANANGTAIQLRYADDIDNSRAVDQRVEVLATAKGGPAVCNEPRPVIFRKTK